MIFYKLYPYSVKATLCSVLLSIIALVFAGLAFFSFYQIDNMALKISGAAVCAVAAIFSFTYLSRVIPDKIAEKDFNTKIKSNAKFAFRYCKEHPEHFEAVAEENTEFAENYRLNEKGKVEKIK